MEAMKWDMGGAGAVAGAMRALAARKAKADVVGICVLAENMPDGNAQRPGDVVTSMSGQTIEVINTDAEGRLVLADAMTWAQRQYKPEIMVDLATLTGAMIVSLGYEYAGLFSNDDKLAKAVRSPRRRSCSGSSKRASNGRISTSPARFGRTSRGRSTTRARPGSAWPCSTASSPTITRADAGRFLPPGFLAR
jgi:hypothetical protein